VRGADSTRSLRAVHSAFLLSNQVLEASKTSRSEGGEARGGSPSHGRVAGVSHLLVRGAEGRQPVSWPCGWCVSSPSEGSRGDAARLMAVWLVCLIS
jgi:hypothetical protein